jgi:hypothetical protein
MDQRGFFGPYEPAETDSPRPDRDSAPAARLASWARMAAVRAARHDLVPTQREYAA